MRFTSEVTGCSSEWIVCSSEETACSFEWMGCSSEWIECSSEETACSIEWMACSSEGLDKKGLGVVQNGRGELSLEWTGCTFSSEELGWGCSSEGMKCSLVGTDCTVYQKGRVLLRRYEVQFKRNGV